LFYRTWNQYNLEKTYSKEVLLKQSAKMINSTNILYHKKKNILIRKNKNQAKAVYKDLTKRKKV